MSEEILPSEILQNEAFSGRDEETNEFLELKAQLLGSFLKFTQFFYYIRLRRQFKIGQPIAREALYITIGRALTKVMRGEIKRLIINVPPRYGKTELLIHFVAWTLARFPDSNYLYVSYSQTLAAEQTSKIKEIIELPIYRKLFGVKLSQISSAKADFKTTAGGSVYAAGAGGTITGYGAGIRGSDSFRFGGAQIMDDMHKPDEAPSDVIRKGVIEWEKNTMRSRLNDGNDTPRIFLGQRVHEDDLPQHLIDSGDWEVISLPALDEMDNALNPEIHTREELQKMQKEMEYEFAAQYQQNPVPAGGGLFKEKDFVLLEKDPEILVTFITADSAETAKEYNDATVFSFWGLYKIDENSVAPAEYGLHWLDCAEMRVEPKYLESEFRQFFTRCTQYPVKPKVAAIEKKSTGVTLVSVLEDARGVEIVGIERTSKSGSKSARFISIQPFIATKLISLTTGANHATMCIEHCSKITANNTHRHDDIADTLYDAIKIALIDKTLIYKYLDVTSEKQNVIVRTAASNFKRFQKLRENRSWL